MVFSTPRVRFDGNYAFGDSHFYALWRRKEVSLFSNSELSKVFLWYTVLIYSSPRICFSDWKVADASRNYAADNASSVAEEQHQSYTESLLYPEVLEAYVKQ